MVPVMQTIGGIGGNCFQACVASVMELPLEEVPHFFEGSNGGLWTQEQWDRVQDFAVSKLYKVTYIEMPEEPALADRLHATDLHYVAFGPSPAGTFGHCVVWHEGKMVHDPAGRNCGLAGDPWLFVVFEVDQIQGGY